MDHVEIWDKAKALLREELANVSYTTWIDQPLKPVYVVDDKLALEVISEFTEKTIRARYLSMITEAVSQVAGREMSVELMSVNPARRFGISLNPAENFTVFDLGAHARVNPEEFLSMGRSTPFAGDDVYGICRLTVCDGKIAYPYANN